MFAVWRDLELGGSISQIYRQTKLWCRLSVGQTVARVYQDEEGIILFFKKSFCKFGCERRFLFPDTWVVSCHHSIFTLLRSPLSQQPYVDSFIGETTKKIKFGLKVVLFCFKAPFVGYLFWKILSLEYRVTNPVASWKNLVQAAELYLLGISFNKIGISWWWLENILE
jgi:hypothetical protein